MKDGLRAGGSGPVTAIVAGSAGAGAVEEEIHGLWAELAALLGELDRRRREALDFGLQVRRHKLLAAAGAALVFGLAALFVRRRPLVVLVVRPPRRLLPGR